MRTAQPAPAFEASRALQSAREALQQMVRSAEVHTQGDTSVVRLHLQPGRLGDLDLRIAVEQGVLTARFVAQSEQVRALIESALPDLKQNLEQHGVSVEQLSVSVGDGRSGGEREYTPSQSQSPTRSVAAAARPDAPPRPEVAGPGSRTYGIRPGGVDVWA